jgi:hypothetical protein
VIAAVFKTLRTFFSGFGGRDRRKQDMRLLHQSGLFDATWYLEAYPDVRESGVDPLRHYLESGWREGRDPGPNFSSAAYLKGNSDVAALGVNPLLHFVEYGHAEGRGTPEFGQPTRSSIKPLEEFGAAAPCLSAPLPIHGFIPWKRAGRITPNAGRTIEIEGRIVAFARDDAAHQHWQEASAQFKALTSWTERGVDAGKLEWGEGLAILDAWKAGRGILRFRWHPGPTPLVVRALRHNRDGLIFTGEAVITSDLDILDVRGAADLGPILFLFTTVEGEIVGTRVLTFPALCRGGLYYAEFLAISATGQPALDIASVDRALCEKLVRLRADVSAPLISGIIVDVDQCDGTQPLFDARYQSWLTDLFGVSISATVTTPKSTANGYLLSTIPTDMSKRAAGTALKIHGGMIPAISVLVAAGGAYRRDEEVLGSLIVSAEEPAQPSTHVRVPQGLQADGLPGQGLGLPSLSGAPDDELVAIALQVPRHRVPTEAELLFPALRGQSTGDLEEQSRTTWLIWPEQWKSQHLADALEALALQSRRPAAILAVGNAPQNPGFFQVAKDLGHALSLVKTDFVGYLGAGIVFHDRRTAEVLEEIAKSTAALTASPEVISVEPRGSGWIVRPDAAADLHRLPRMILPLAGPPQDLWIARTRSVKDWLSKKQLPGRGSHLCTSHVTVSRLGLPSKKSPIDLPPADMSQAIALDLLVG